MYINKIANHVIKIKDEDLFLLLERYNLDNFEVLETVNGEKVYKNITKCPFCERYYKSSCIGCPFKNMETNEYGEIIFGCENALRILMGGVDLDDIRCTADEVVFYESTGNHIRESIQNIYDFFSSSRYI